MICVKTLTKAVREAGVLDCRLWQEDVVDHGSRSRKCQSAGSVTSFSTNTCLSEEAFLTAPEVSWRSNKSQYPSILVLLCTDSRPLALFPSPSFEERVVCTALHTWDTPQTWVSDSTWIQVALHEYILYSMQFNPIFRASFFNIASHRAVNIKKNGKDSLPHLDRPKKLHLLVEFVPFDEVTWRGSGGMDIVNGHEQHDQLPGRRNHIWSQSSHCYLHKYLSWAWTTGRLSNNAAWQSLWVGERRPVKTDSKVNRRTSVVNVALKTVLKGLMVKLVHFWCFLCKTIWEPQHIPAWNPFLRLACSHTGRCQSQGYPGHREWNCNVMQLIWELWFAMTSVRLIFMQWFWLFLTFSVPFL